MELKIITYNVRGKSAPIRLLMRHYKNERAIFIIQEYPKKPPAILKKYKVWSDPQSKNVFISTINIRLNQIHEKPKGSKTEMRFSAFSFDIGDDTCPNTILLIGLHGFDLRNYQLGSLNRYIREITLYEEMRYLFAGQTIIGGDFNTDPYSQLLASSGGLMARNDDDLIYPPEIVMINPMWKFISMQNEGTHYFKSPETEKTWRVIDQFIYEPYIKNKLNPEVAIIKQLAGVDLRHKHSVFSNYFEMNSDYSDHLPVELTLNWSKK